jgi:hypothetical protein
MSPKKLDHIFPKKTPAEIELKITKNLKKILRDHYHESPSALKWICLKTGAHERAARNWYNGLNTPRSGHLLALARSYPAVLQMLLELIERPDLAAMCSPQRPSARHQGKNEKTGASARDEGAISCTINVTINLSISGKLNQRQLWFLGMLQHGQNVKAENITRTWSVSLRTAKYDIAAMIDAGLIRFVGIRGTGRYVVF